MKSGTTLNGCTLIPRRLIAAISAIEIVVFPTPLFVLAIITAGLHISTASPFLSRLKRLKGQVRAF